MREREEDRTPGQRDNRTEKKRPSNRGKGRFVQKSLSRKETSASEQITRKIERRGGAWQKDGKQQCRRGAGKSGGKIAEPGIEYQDR